MQNYFWMAVKAIVILTVFYYTFVFIYTTSATTHENSSKAREYRDTSSPSLVLLGSLADDKTNNSTAPVDINREIPNGLINANNNIDSNFINAESNNNLLSQDNISNELIGGDDTKISEISNDVVKLSDEDLSVAENGRLSFKILEGFDSKNIPIVVENYVLAEPKPQDIRVVSSVNGVNGINQARARRRRNADFEDENNSDEETNGADNRDIDDSDNEISIEEFEKSLHDNSLKKNFARVGHLGRRYPDHNYNRVFIGKDEYNINGGGNKASSVEGISKKPKKSADLQELPAPIEHFYGPAPNLGVGKGRLGGFGGGRLIRGQKTTTSVANFVSAVTYKSSAPTTPAAIKSSTVKSETHKQTTTVKLTPKTVAPPTKVDKPLILFWNPIFSLWQAKRSMKSCESYFHHSTAVGNQAITTSAEPMCEITTDRSLYKESDIVIFHPFQLSLFDLPNSTLLSHDIRSKQKWVFVSQESPSNLKERTSTNTLSTKFPYPTITGWESMFDWLVTYNMVPTSDFFYPYGKRVRLEPDPKRKIGLDPKNLKRRKLIAAVVSNCQCKKRMEFIRKLKEYLPEMDVFGKCFDKPICMDKQKTTTIMPSSSLRTTTKDVYGFAQEYFKTVSPLYQSLTLTPPNVQDPNADAPVFRVPVLPDQLVKAMSCKSNRDLYYQSTDRKVGDITKKTVVKDVAAKNHSCLLDLISNYKFVIAIENSANCPDYITEKYWVWPLKTGTIPIVGGSNRATYKRLAIPGSFIHVDDYAGVEDLARHIRHIDGNAAAQLRLLEWRKHWTIGESIPDTWCDLCAQAKKEVTQGQIERVGNMIDDDEQDNYGDDNNEFEPETQMIERNGGTRQGKNGNKQRANLANSRQVNKKKFNNWWNGCSRYFK